MRQIAGSFVRGELHRLSIDIVLGMGMVLGLGVGLAFYVVFPKWIGFGWGYVAYVATAVGLFVFVRVFERPPFGWSFDNLKKGLDAETYVGQIIEYAITVENCAVAHSVTKIAKVKGDIDHIVATPKAIWVIETKYRKVPPKSFPEVLRRIAENVDAVRQCQWVPAGMEVRGCLVLAFESKMKIKNYPYRKENIIVYHKKSLKELMQELRKEAQSKRPYDKQLVEDIWKLGHIAE